MDSLRRGFCLGAMILVIAGASAWAQATAQLTGSVRDESGAVLQFGLKYGF